MKRCLNCGFENPDDAHYCAKCRFTLDWSSTESPDPTVVLTPGQAQTLELAVGPAEKRVAPGERVTFELRVANRGSAPARVQLRVAGAAAEWATVEPAALEVAPGPSAPAVLTVVVPADAAPGTVPVEIYAVDPEGTGASVTAQAALAIESPELALYRRERLRGGLRAALLALVVAALVVAAIFVLSSGGGSGGGGSGGGGDTTGGAGSGSGIRGVALQTVCVHSVARFGDDTHIPPNGGDCKRLEKDQEFRAVCQQNGLVRISAPDDFKGTWVTAQTNWVSLDSVPDAC